MLSSPHDSPFILVLCLPRSSRNSNAVTPCGDAKQMAAVRHLGFSKIRLLNIGTPWTADFPSLYQIWRKNIDRRRNYGRKSKSKMAAVRHLRFVTPSYRTTHEVYSLDYIAISNFMLIRCIVLKI